MSTTREWYRNLVSGDRGYKEDGKMFLDRVPAVELTYVEGDWQKEPDAAPLTERQIGRIAFAADRELCRMLGKIYLAKREWISLGEEEQLHFSKYGPSEPDSRQKLFWDIKAALTGEAIR